MRRSIEHAKLDTRAVAQIGMRGFISTARIDYQVENGITVIPMRELNEIGVQEAAGRAMDAVRSHCDAVYLTIDIDSVDPSCASGTCCPVPGGIMGGDFVDCFRALGKYREIVALDLVEVAPPLDPADITSNLAAHAIFNFLEEYFLLERG
jgi:agmatinase